MAKLGATNPVTGTKMDLSFNGIISMIVGVIVLFFVWAMGQKAASAVERRVPMIDTSPDPLWKQEVAVQTNKRVFV
jgi:hypothetical protein